MDHEMIEVTFINADTGKVFVHMSMSADELPPKFDHLSTLNIGNQRWGVIYSEPSDERGYRISGELILVVRRIDVDAPEGVLFSLPSISDVIPANDGPSENSTNAFILHEDYWQQQEFISSNLQTEIDSELRAIEKIYTEHGVLDDGQHYIGFSKVHIRRLIHHPLMVNLTIDALEESLPPDRHRYDAVTYEDGGVAQDGFAYRFGPLVIYGHAPQNRVAILALEQTGQANLSDDLVEVVADLMEKYQFLLVDWRHLQAVRHARSDLKDYLYGYFIK